MHQLQVYYTMIILLTQISHWANQYPSSHQKLCVYAIGCGVLWKLKEQRTDNCGGWGIGLVHWSVSLVEQSIVVGKERVANGKNLSTDSSYLGPTVKLLCRERNKK